MLTTRLTAYIKTHQDYQSQRRAMHEAGGEILRELRAEKQLSVRKMAKELRLSPSYLSKVERGLEMLSPEVAARVLEQITS